MLRLPRFPGNQLVEIVAVRTEGAKRLLIKQALDSATQADLIRMLLEAYRPAHLAMPATAQNQNCGASHAGRH